MAAPTGNKNAAGNEGGRPTTFDPSFVEKIPEYLKWCEENPITIDEGGGKTRTSPRLPSIAGFARHVHVPRTTLLSWAEAEIEFSTGLQELGDEQQKQLYELGRAGEGNSRFAQFLLSATHGHRERSETDVTSKGESINQNVAKLDDDQLERLISSIKGTLGPGSLGETPEDSGEPA